MEKNRDLFFDTLKGFLIILVLIGHIGGDNLRNNEILQTLEIFIYLFHMPMFIFISGYFSKNLEKNEKNSFKNLFFVYLIFQLLYGMWSLILHNENVYLKNIFFPAPALWYILALFIWKKVLQDFLKLKLNIIYIILLYVLSSVIPILNTTIFSIGRCIAFFPFFLLGYYVDKEKINLIRKKLNKYVSFFIIIFFIIVSYCFLQYSGIEYENIIDFLCHRVVIYNIFENTLIGIVANILLIPIAILISISFISLINENNVIGDIGRDTLPIYICHPYFQDIFRYIQRKILIISNDYINFLISMFFVILTLFILSNKYFRNLFNNIILKLKNIFFKEENKSVKA